MEIQYIIMIVSLLASAFFSGMEIAFVSNNKLKVGLLKQENGRLAKIISGFYDKQSRFLSTILIGNNIALVIFGIAIASLVGYWFPNINNDFLQLLVQTIISTIIVLFLGEFIPKILFQLNPNAILKFFAIPFSILYILLWLPVQFINSISGFFIRKVFQQDDTIAELEYSKVDLGDFVMSSAYGTEEQEDLNTDLFEKALYLTKVKVRECMLPRPEIEAVDITCTIEELVQKFVDTKHSRILVYSDSIDSVLGYIHHHDMLKKPKNLQSIIIPIKVVPETMPVRSLMDVFIKERKSIAKVVDEFGGTAGIITLEDIIEEIFGEIEDEHDVPEFIEEQISLDEFIFSGRLEVDYLNEKYELKIPDGEYETLAGFIFSVYEHIPKMGENIRTEDFDMKVISVSKTRIETVKLKQLKPSQFDY